MSKKLAVAVPEKKDAFSRIVRFMDKADITLSADEENIMQRWFYCGALIRQKLMNHEEMVEDLCKKFSISKFTAISDINQTHKLNGRIIQINKKFLLHLHLERIDKVIQSNLSKTDALEILPKLFDSYTKAIQAIPEDTTADKQPPPQFIFNLAPGQTIDGVMPAEEALKAADEILMKENGDGVYEIPTE